MAVTFGTPSCSEDGGTDWLKVVGGISLDVPDNTILLIGGELQLGAEVFPSGAPDKSVKWESDNPSVATVDGNGLVKAVGEGEANISVTSVSNSTRTKSCRVTVLSTLTVSLNANALTRIPAGGARTLKATVLPTSITQEVTWSSSNPGVATVEGGVVTAVSAGTATITAASAINENQKAECTVSVVNVSLPTHEWLYGMWTFEDESNSGKATVGLDLEPTANFSFVDGPTAGDKAVVVPHGQYYICKHGIAPSGMLETGDPATRVNEYTLLVDFKVSGIGVYYSFLQTNPANNDDAELFIRPAGNIGIGGGYYSAGSVQGETWYRWVVTIKCGEYFKQYLNGQLLSETGPGESKLSIDNRFSLDPATILLFADENGEDHEMQIAAAALWNKALSAEEVASLGRTNTPIK
ncbi:MAG: Ig-like domain-containing protein [Tannerella sp.]|nr:Ig-like domain-containing protein [Tannerella sp.]